MVTDLTSIEAGTIEFTIHHRRLNWFDPRGLGKDQAITIKVLGDLGGKKINLLRFDCFEKVPHYHYHYGPGHDLYNPEVPSRNRRVMIDKTVDWDSLSWTMNQLRYKPPDMLNSAGHEEIANHMDQVLVATRLDEVEAVASKLFSKHGVQAQDRGKRGVFPFMVMRSLQGILVLRRLKRRAVGRILRRR